VMNDLCIHHHLGLGDHFDLNGLVRYYLKEPDVDRVHVFSKSNYYSMVDHMYRDEDNIIVVEIDRHGDEHSQVHDYMTRTKIKKFLRIGFENYPFGTEVEQNKNCWEYFYEQVDVPYNVRVDEFYCRRDEEEEKRLLNKLNPEGKPFLFLHDDPGRGFEIDREKINKDLFVVENDNTENIFLFLKVIECAEEIHCMESSFKSLIDLYGMTDRLYYHDFRNHPLGARTNKKWNIVKYEHE